jgi:cysteine desulfurase
MIYLDNNASSPLDPEAWASMRAAADVYGNASSVHAEGQRARRIVEESREEIARLLGARPEEIVLTSGGTESNAMAIFGAAAGRRGRIVLSGAEHPSVREAAAQAAASSGQIEVVAIDPEPSGALDPGRVLDAVVPDRARLDRGGHNGGLTGGRSRRRGPARPFHTDL